MEQLLDPIRTGSSWNRILLILVLALVAHAMVLAVRRLGNWLLERDGTDPRSLARRRPKLASVTTLAVSTLTFVVYFSALGIILGELGIALTAYFASATVIGLAIGFGSQGLVQDVVIGLTLIFSDAIDVGDVADIGGQTGRVESIGLRFITLRTVLDQRVVVPNRNVGQIHRYRRGYVRAYVDVQLPADAPEAEAVAAVERIARGMAAQHRGLIIGDPDNLGVRAADPGDWRYLRLKFRMWPGQGALLEGILRQRVVSALRKLDEAYSDWMVVITYRAS